MMNGMDRVMHLSFVTTAPRHEGGQGIAMEMKKETISNAY